MAHRGLEVFRAMLAVDAQRAERGGQLLVHRLLRCSIGIAELCADQVRLQRQSQVSWKLESNHKQITNSSLQCKNPEVQRSSRSGLVYVCVSLAIQ